MRITNKENTINEPSSTERIKSAFKASIVSTVGSITINVLFKVLIARLASKNDLATFHTCVDILTLSFILLSGFRSTMAVNYSRTDNEKEIINIFRIAIIFIALCTWGVVLPVIRDLPNINVNYLFLVSIIIGMTFKIYFANQVAMYRMYNVSNKVIFIEPLVQLISFLVFLFILKTTMLPALFYSMSCAYFSVGFYMYYEKRILYMTQPLKIKNFTKDVHIFVRQSFVSSLDSVFSIIMPYMLVFLIAKYYSIDDLTNYQMVVRPAFIYLTFLFVFPIYRFAIPELSVCLKTNNTRQIKLIRKMIYKLGLTVGLCFFTCTLLFGRNIISFLFPDNYIGGLKPLILVSSFFVIVIFNAYNLSFIKAHGSFGVSLIIRMLGIVALVSSFYTARMFSDNLLTVFISWFVGIMLVFIFSYRQERHIFKAITR